MMIMFVGGLAVKAKLVVVHCFINDGKLIGCFGVEMMIMLVGGLAVKAKLVVVGLGLVQSSTVQLGSPAIMLSY